MVHPRNDAGEENVLILIQFLLKCEVSGNCAYPHFTSLCKGIWKCFFFGGGDSILTLYEPDFRNPIGWVSVL